MPSGTPSIDNADIPYNCKYIRLTQYIAINQTGTLQELKDNTKQVMVSYGNDGIYVNAII